MDTLYLNVIVLILTMVKLQDVANMRLVSKRFKIIIDKNLHLYRGAAIGNILRLKNEAIFKAINFQEFYCPLWYEYIEMPSFLRQFFTTYLSHEQSIRYCLEYKDLSFVKHITNCNSEITKKLIKNTDSFALEIIQLIPNVCREYGRPLMEELIKYHKKKFIVDCHKGTYPDITLMSDQLLDMIGYYCFFTNNKEFIAQFEKCHKFTRRDMLMIHYTNKTVKPVWLQTTSQDLLVEMLTEFVHSSVEQFELLLQYYDFNTKLAKVETFIYYSCSGKIIAAYIKKCPPQSVQKFLKWARYQMRRDVIEACTIRVPDYNKTLSAYCLFSEHKKIAKLLQLVPEAKCNNYWCTGHK